MNTISKSDIAKAQAILDKKLGRGPLVNDFAPNGRSGLFIYAVTVSHHPDKVKIGMTRNWKKRRREYANWNLSTGDAITGESVFCINEEFVDLRKLENHILMTFPMKVVSGAEWFSATLEDASRHIDRIMCEHGISYSL